MDLMSGIVKRGKIKKIKKMIDIEVLLKAIGAETKEAKRYGKEKWDLCPHPNHKDGSPSWSINMDHESERFGTHNCFSCGFKGNFITLTSIRLTHSTGKEVTNQQALEFIIKLFSIDGIDEETIYDLVLEERKAIMTNTEEEEEKGPKEAELPDEYELVVENKRCPYYKYLTKPISKGGRGLSYDLIRKHNIGYCNEGKYANRIIIPFMQEGKLISFLARSILPPINSKKKNGKEFVVCPECKKMNKYGSDECIKCDHDLSGYVVKKARARYPKGSTMEYMLWGIDELDPELDYAIAVEGAMDKARLEQLGYKNLLCLFGNKVSDFQVELLKKHQKKIGKKLRIFIFPDADEGGDTLIEFANAKLKYDFPAWVVELPWQPDDWLDPGNASPKQIRSAFNKASKLYQVYARKFN
jgi:CHC2 zinc finger/Toprim domain